MSTACYQPLQPMLKRRRYSDTLDYSPRLLNQPTVPEPPPTQIYHDFVTTVPDQSGKLAIVTGANSGLGYWAARTLAYRGASVILACRSMEKGEEARERMLADLAEHGVASADVRVRFLDLSSFSQVREFGAALRRSEQKVDMLLNNAGVMGVLRYDTEDGWDVQFQVNHLGHFLLTHELLPLLVKAPDGGRIVQHASLAHLAGFFDAVNPNEGGRRWMAPVLPPEWRRYAQSKLANLLFAYELGSRFAARGLPTVSVAAHPGFSMTHLLRVAAGAQLAPWQRYLTGWHMASDLGVTQSAQDGCASLVHAATSPSAQSGDYFGPTKRAQTVGMPGKVASHGFSHDTRQAAALWLLSEMACGITFGEGAW